MIPLLKELISESRQATSQTIEEIWAESVDILKDITLSDSDRKSLYDWVVNRGNIKVDHRPFDFEGKHPYLIDIYKDNSKKIVISSAAQVGKSVYEMLKLIYKARYYAPSKLGFYFPTRDALQRLVTDRFDPMMASIPGMKRIFDLKTTSGKKPADNTVIKQLLDSTIYFLWMGGTVSKDSTPLDILLFDEVRLMLLNEIEQVQMRLLHSEIKEETYVSTYGYPGDAIDVLYKRSTQKKFHTECRCSDGILLAEVFPNCLGERSNPKKSQEKYFYRCPKCDMEIRDNQKGRWIAHEPQNDEIVGFHVHGLLRHKSIMSPAELWQKMQSAQNSKEFTNSIVGLPFLDVQNVSLTRDQMQACVNNSLSWKENGRNTFMGIDQMAGFNYVVIKELSDEGLSNVIHLEIIYDDEPFNRCRELMNIYDVRLAVSEQAPNFNSAFQFAKAFNSRVFLVSDYNASGSKYISWLDRDLAPPDQRKTSQELKFKYMVSLNHYKVYEHSFKRWANRQNRVPNPMTLIQRIKVRDIPPELRDRFYKSKGLDTLVPVSICGDIFFDHMTRMVKDEREKVVKDKLSGQELGTGQYTYFWVKRGIDPHFASANMLCDVAIARVKPPQDILFV